MSEREVLHGFPPVVGQSTRVLVLGSFPSAASLRAGQYYAHPRNLFWPLVGELLGKPLEKLDYQERIDWVASRGLGIWDVYRQCQRTGSLDADIRAPVLNDVQRVISQLPRLRMIAHNGRESAKVMKFTRALGFDTVVLPSTSPANASWSRARKKEAWARAFDSAGLTVSSP
jgi:hypoxanthine-DNA glycosylase